MDHMTGDIKRFRLIHRRGVSLLLFIGMVFSLGACMNRANYGFSAADRPFHSAPDLMSYEAGFRQQQVTSTNTATLTPTASTSGTLTVTPTPTISPTPTTSISVSPTPGTLTPSVGATISLTPSATQPVQQVSSPTPPLLPTSSPITIPPSATLAPTPALSPSTPETGLSPTATSTLIPFPSVTLIIPTFTKTPFLYYLAHVDDDPGLQKSNRPITGRLLRFWPIILIFLAWSFLVTWFIALQFLDRR